MRSVFVHAGRFTCRLSMISCWRKSAFSVMSSDLLLPRSAMVRAAKRRGRSRPTNKEQVWNLSKQRDNSATWRIEQGSQNEPLLREDG